MARTGNNPKRNYFVDRDGERHSIYDFDLDKIKAHCSKIRDINQQLDYLDYGLKERRTRRDHDVNHGVLDAEDLFQKDYRWFKREIIFLEKIRSRSESTPSSAAGHHPETVSKVCWQGTKAQLVYTINLLCERGFWPTAKKWQSVADHFVDREGKPFVPKQLSSAYAALEQNKKAGNPQGVEKLEEHLKK